MVACTPPLAIPCSYGATSFVTMLVSGPRASEYPPVITGSDTHKPLGSSVTAVTTLPIACAAAPVSTMVGSDTRLVMRGTTSTWTRILASPVATNSADTWVGPNPNFDPANTAKLAWNPV